MSLHQNVQWSSESSRTSRCYVHRSRSNPFQVWIVIRKREILNWFCRFLLNYLRTNTFIEPQSVQERVELLLEAEYYQITSLVQRLQYETATTTTNAIVLEKLFFDSNQHHPKVVISDNGLKASHNIGCTKCLYAKVSNNSWQNGRHYWEIIMETTKSTAFFFIITTKD